MALIDLNIFSEALGMQTTVMVAIPQRSNQGEIGVSNGAAAEEFPCLYLLHGLSDDQSIWMRRTSIERYAAQYGLCVVMPCGGRSFYSDMKYGLKYYTYIAKELPAMIEDMFHVSPRREDRYIGGLSMGGYGALKIALREKERYAAAFGLSSVADIYNENFTDTLKAVFGDEIPKDHDLFTLASQHEKDEVKSRLYMTVGRDDFMYRDNLRLKSHFEMLDYDYTYVETAGAHCWEVWDTTVQEALKWIFK